MRMLLEITSDGDITDDGETYALFDFDPEALSNDPIERPSAHKQSAPARRPGRW
jgi:hypothetical protein